MAHGTGCTAQIPMRLAASAAPITPYAQSWADVHHDELLVDLTNCNVAFRDGGE